MTRPENQMPANSYYDSHEAVKYTNCSRIITVQREMAIRCMELLGIPFNREVIESEDEDEEYVEDSKFIEDPLNILDLGCGSGLSGEVISEWGHNWWGIDISKDMLTVAQERLENSEYILGDIGHGLPFAAGYFDAIISVSALQWLCYSEKTGQIPFKRLLAFFSSVQRCLKLEGRAVIQFYPENRDQLELISNAAIKAGLSGGIYIDYPNSAMAKKYYLVLSTAVEGKLSIVIKEGKNEMTDECQKKKKKIKKGKKNKEGKFEKKSKFWIFEKKERLKKQGIETKNDSKYTGRRRKPYF